MLPLLNPLFEGLLHSLGLQRQGSDGVVVLDGIDFVNGVLEFSVLGLIILKRGVLGIESLGYSIHLGVPQPVEFVEALLECEHVVLCALDRTSEQEDDLDDLLVSGNPGVEGLALIFREVLLVPVLHLTCRFKHFRCSDVNGSLNVSK